MKRFLVAIMVLFLVFPAFAQEEPVKGFRDTNLPLPRFVSLKSDEVYVRAGPATRYPIRWIYKRAGLPVEIIQEFENWRKIKDMAGDEGWVHQSLLTGSRSVIVRPQAGGDGASGSVDMDSDMTPLREKPDLQARMSARLEPNVIASLDRCEKGWCRVETGGFRGWVQRNLLWGIYESEQID